MLGKEPGNIVKVYPKRGPIAQYRFDKSIAFSCFRCNQEKKAKLITIYNDNWNKRLCNGCYGRLLSIYEIKVGSEENEVRIASLETLLESLVSEDEIRREIQKLTIKENKANLLHNNSLRFVASSDYISSKLGGDEYLLDWSPVIIGYCKALEYELIEKLMIPLKEYTSKLDLTDDLKDMDLGRIAKFLSKSKQKPPELGTIMYFLETVINSKSRRKTSTLVKSFYDFISEYPKSNWLIDMNGLVKDLKLITKNYRNKAAHIDELCKNDYEAIKEILFNNPGVFWNIILATKKR